MEAWKLASEIPVEDLIGKVVWTARIDNDGKFMTLESPMREEGYGPDETLQAVAKAINLRMKQ